MITRTRRGSARCILVFLLALTLQACAETSGTIVPDIGAKPMSNVAPVYPKTMEKLGIEGSVSMNCIVTRAGVTEDCRVTRSTRSEFTQAALSYAAAARYTPATRNGVPTWSRQPYNINFKLTRKPADPPGLQHYLCVTDRIGVMLGCRLLKPTEPQQAAQYDNFLMKVVTAVMPDPNRHTSVSFLALRYPGNPQRQLPPSDVEVNAYFRCPRHPTHAGHCIRTATEDLVTVSKDTDVFLIAVGIAINGVISSATSLETVTPILPASAASTGL